MSWNLLIYRARGDEEPTPLGSRASVTKAMNSAFAGLQWPTTTECGLYVDGGFTIEWNIDGEEVIDGYTNGGYQHLKALAALCKKMGWRLADAQEGEEIDLDDPYATFTDEDDE